MRRITHSSKRKNTYNDDKAKRNFLNHQNAQRLKRERQLLLVKEARSHGAYLWNEKDLEHSLLWFEYLPSKYFQGDKYNTEKSNDEHTDERKNNDPDKSRTGTVYYNQVQLFIKALLHSPGVTQERPQKIESSCNDRKRSRKETDKFILSNPDKIEILKKRRAKELQDREPLLRHLILGFLAVSRGAYVDQSDYVFINNLEGRGDDVCNPENSDYSLEGGRLLSMVEPDITDIAVMRSLTDELFDFCKKSSFSFMYLDKAGRKKNELVPKLNPFSFDLFALSRSRVEQEAMKYFTSSDAIVHMTYAAQLFDRLLERDTNFRNDVETTYHTSWPESDSILKHQIKSSKISFNSNKMFCSMESFLSKIRALGRHDKRIKEVLVFMLLEPSRRRNGGILRLEEISHANSSKEHVDIISDRCFKILCKSVLPSGNENDDIIDAIGVGDKNDIWKLPFPLLCAASKVCFQFAAAYMKHLINTAVEAHFELPRLLANRAAALCGKGAENFNIDYQHDDIENYCHHKSALTKDALSSSFYRCVLCLQKLSASDDSLFLLFGDIMQKMLDLYPNNGISAPSQGYFEEGIIGDLYVRGGWVALLKIHRQIIGKDHRLHN